MEDVLKIASYVSQCYEYQFGTRIEEIKLHILLYFIQREYIVQTEKLLFKSIFYAKSFGPYLHKVHTAYVEDDLHNALSPNSLEDFASVFNKVFSTLASKKTRSLINLVHGEHSWKTAYSKGDDTPINIGDIEKDAQRFRIRCFLLNNLEDFRKPIYT